MACHARTNNYSYARRPYDRQAAFRGSLEFLARLFPAFPRRLDCLPDWPHHRFSLKKLVMRVCDVLKLDALAEKLEVKQMFRKAGVPFNISALLGWIIKWFFVIVFLIASSDIMQWVEVTGFLKEVVFYLPNVIIAVIIMLVGIWWPISLGRLLSPRSKRANWPGPTSLASISRWAILIFSFMAALVQLGIAEDLDPDSLYWLGGYAGFGRRTAF